MASNTIILKGNGIHKEALAGGTITPGMLLARNSSNAVVAHNAAGGCAQRAFALENELEGEDITDNYVSGDVVPFVVLDRGAEVYALLAIGQSVSVGAFLGSDGAGALQAVTTTNVVTQYTGAVTDDDDAATNGTAVYAHIDEKAEGAAPIAHLESVTAGNANTYFTVGNGGPLCRVLDDDAANSGGYAVYFDEDATSEDSRFLINNAATGKDVFVVLSDGSFLRLKHDASANSHGVALYVDDDASNAYARLLFVSPTNAAGSYKTDDSLTWKGWTDPDSVIGVALEAVNNSAGSAAARIKVEVL